MLRALLELSRVSNLPTVWTNVLAAWIIASGGDWKWAPSLGWLLLGASLVYSAGMVLNDACDATWDRNHRPERPIPSGKIGLRTVWITGLTWMLGGAALMVFAGGASGVFTSLLVAAIVAYDAYHKPWAGSVVVMGACRTLLYLAAGSAASSAAGARVLAQSAQSGAQQVALGGLVLGVYVVGLTLLARSEATGKATPASRRILSCLLLSPALVSILAYLDVPLDQRSSLIVLPFFVSAVAYALVQMKRGGKHIGDAVGWLLASIPLVDALMVANLSLVTALAFTALPPFLRLWQRWVAAT
jgi:4-hydroxybenzoate polyprenyltransferase